MLCVREWTDNCSDQKKNWMWNDDVSTDLDFILISMYDCCLCQCEFCAHPEKYFLSNHKIAVAIIIWDLIESVIKPRLTTVESTTETRLDGKPFSSRYNAREITHLHSTHVHEYWTTERKCFIHTKCTWAMRTPEVIDSSIIGLLSQFYEYKSEVKQFQTCLKIVRKKYCIIAICEYIWHSKSNRR